MRSTRRCREGVAAKGDGRQGRWRRLARLEPKLAQPKRECIPEGAGRGNGHDLAKFGCVRDANEHTEQRLAPLVVRCEWLGSDAQLMNSERARHQTGGLRHELALAPVPHTDQVLLVLAHSDN